MKKTIMNLAFLLLSTSIFSLTESVDNTTLYNKALGGAHTGMVKGFDSFFNNPALLAEYDSEFSFMDLAINMKGDALDLLNLYLGGDLSFDDPTTILATLQENELTSLLVGVDLPGPISIGQIGHNWGWSLKNSSSIYIDIPGLLATSNFVVREDLVLSAGIAFPFELKLGESFFVKLTPGVMSRTTLRGEIEIDSDLLGLMGYISDLTSILDTYPLNISPMFAIDVGFVINVYDIFSLSGVVKDLYTPILKYPVTTLEGILEVFSSNGDTTGNLSYREINFGLSLDVPLGILSVVISDLDIYADYFDLLDTDKNTMLHLGAGIDVELLEKFHLLAGMNEGLLSLGLNIDVAGFNVGFAMYGTEESTQPGVNSVFNFLISFGISF